MKKYSKESAAAVSFPLGGIGAGMICIEGNGAFGSLSIQNRPDIKKRTLLFSALTVKDDENITKVLESTVPSHKIFTGADGGGGAGCGLLDTTCGFPHYKNGEFSSRFPFANINLSDNTAPFDVCVNAWSPFIPGDEDSSSLPFAGIEYTFTNKTAKKLDAVYYFCTANFFESGNKHSFRAVENGFVLEYKGDAFGAAVDREAYIDTAWFRGGWFDPVTMKWNDILKGSYENKKHKDFKENPGKGATIAVPFTLESGEVKTVRLRLSWHSPNSELFLGSNGDCERGNAAAYSPWYSSVISDIDCGMKMWSEKYDDLYNKTEKFTNCFYDSTLPEEITEAVSANLSILKSPTILRQTDGRLWGWEGCCNDSGSCSGSCTHVWNYAQSICNLFPRLERSLRETEFNECQDDIGFQEFRAPLPIRKAEPFHRPASDGQLGGIIKIYRDWLISGDTDWLRNIWTFVKKSMDFCIQKWDPNRNGYLLEPHHNTYDIEFWGADGMCTSFYLGALKAAYMMSEVLSDTCDEYIALYNKGREYLESDLWNGEYFYQKVEWINLNEKLDYSHESSEAQKLIKQEGPKYQYGTGCLSDGITGIWLSELSGLTDIISEDKILSNLLSIYKYNFKTDLSLHSNPQRSGYACGEEGGLLLCSWPYGGKPSLPFVYSDEVWTGIEYQVASHLISKGRLKEGLDIVQTCRNRYDGTVRNPYNEYECGSWYARAMASYDLLRAYTGVRYDNVNKTLYAKTLNSKNWKTFFSTQTGYGTVSMRDGRVSIKVISGEIAVDTVIVD